LQRIRILLARMPKMLADILSHLVTSEPDMVVAGWLEAEENLLAAVRRARATVLLVGQEADDEREKYAPLFFRRPRLKVVVVAGDGRTGALYELRPERVPLGEMSAASLRNAIRGRPLPPAGALPAD
jgi:hypothetical protein